jgi:hypothetical protein
MHISSKSDSTAQKFETFAPEALDRFVSEWTQFSDGAIPGMYGCILLCPVITCVLGKQRVKIPRDDNMVPLFPVISNSEMTRATVYAYLTAVWHTYILLIELSIS